MAGMATWVASGPGSSDDEPFRAFLSPRDAVVATLGHRAKRLGRVGPERAIGLSVTDEVGLIGLRSIAASAASL